MAKRNFFKQPRKAASKYKSVSSYLRAVYKANQEQIDNVYTQMVLDTKALNAPKSAYKMFKKELLTQGENINSIGVADLKGRLSSLSRTQLYSRDEQAKENLREIFKKDQFARDIIRKQIGWKKKLDWSNVKYHGDRLDKENRYFYFEDDEGNRIAFKLGSNYKNKKLITLVTLDQNYDIATEYTSEDVRGW